MPSIVFLGTFGLRPKGTMLARALPLARALHERGIEVTLVVPPYDYVEDSGKTFEVDGVRVVNVDARPEPPGLWYPLVVSRLLAAADAADPDVIHVFKPKGFGGAAASVLLARRRRRSAPRIIIDTDDWEEGWNTINDYPRWQKLVFSYQERTLLRQADSVTVASRFLYGFALRQGVSRERLLYLPNGAPDSLPPTIEQNEAKLRLGLEGGPIALLYTRFFEFDPTRAAEALGLALHRIPDAHAVVVGRGHLERERIFTNRIVELGIQDRVRQVGWVEPEQLPLYFSTAAAAIYPIDDTNLNRAKCPAKLIELLAAGVPTAAEAVGQTTEYIEPGISGLLVPTGDPIALGRALAELLENKELRQRIGRAARHRTRERFSWSRLSALLDPLYLAPSRF